MKKTIIAALCAAALMPLTALAFGTEWSDAGTVAIKDPTLATAHFGVLTGDPHQYTFTLAEPTKIYFTVLVPNASSTKKDISAALVDTAHPDIPVGIILGTEGMWTPYTYQGDPYLRSQEYRATVPAGSYQLIVWSSNNDSDYALILGEREPNIFSKVAGALSTLPTVRSVFFDRSSASVVLAPLIYVPIILIIALIILAVWLSRRRA